jgi:hypothetical protein
MKFPSNEVKQKYRAFLKNYQRILSTTLYSNEVFASLPITIEDLKNRAALTAWIDKGHYPHVWRVEGGLDGFKPKHWGPIMWKMLHEIAALYDDGSVTQDLDNWRAFYKSVADVLPCATCAMHYRLFWVQGDKAYIPSDYTNRVELMKWVDDVHASVTKRVGKRARNIQTMLPNNTDLTNNMDPSNGVDNLEGEKDIGCGCNSNIEGIAYLKHNIKRRNGISRLNRERSLLRNIALPRALKNFRSSKEMQYRAFVAGKKSTQ